MRQRRCGLGIVISFIGRLGHERIMNIINTKTISSSGVMEDLTRLRTLELSCGRTSEVL